VIATVIPLLLRNRILLAVSFGASEGSLRYASWLQSSQPTGKSRGTACRAPAQELDSNVRCLLGMQYPEVVTPRTAVE